MEEEKELDYALEEEMRAAALAHSSLPFQAQQGTFCLLAIQQAEQGAPQAAEGGVSGQAVLQTERQAQTNNRSEVHEEDDGGFDFG